MNNTDKDYVTIPYKLCRFLYEEFERQHGSYAQTEETADFAKLRTLMWDFRCAVIDSDVDDVEDLRDQIESLESALTEAEMENDHDDDDNDYQKDCIRNKGVRNLTELVTSLKDTIAKAEEDIKALKRYYP